jgi:hypothetical protein
MTGSNSFWFAKSDTGFYNDVVGQSLRFNDGDSSYLKKTFGSSGSRKKWTFSAWVKKSTLDIDGYLMGVGTGSAFEFIKISNSSTDALEYAYWNGSAYAYQIRTTHLFRDTTAWYHVVIAVDTTQSTASNRVKFYVNGTQITDFSISSYPSEDADTQTTHSLDTRIGSGIGGNYFDGYMADVHLIDGSQLAPTSFGETKNGAWIPIDTSGLTYGTNGFKLNFSQDFTGGSLNTVGGGNIIHSDSSSFDIGSGDDFTIEFFFLSRDLGTGTGSDDYGNFMGEYATSGPHLSIGYDFRSEQDIYLYVGNGSALYWQLADDTLKENEWNHLAIQRDGTVLRAWMNGTRMTTIADAASNTGFTLTSGKATDFNTAYDLSEFNIGDHNNGQRAHTGWISNVRLVVGDGNNVYANSDSNITVPTSTLTKVTGTKLLSCTNSTLGDDISDENNDATNNSAVVSRLTPFGSQFWQDKSGTGNHFDFANFNYYDVVIDNPENNFATLLPERSGENKSSQTFSEGNLQWTSSAYGYNSTGSSINIPTSGKWYFEVYVKTHGTGESHDFGVGIQGVKFDSMSKTDPATATYGDSTHYITRRDFGSRIEKNLGNVYIGTNPGTGTPDEDDSTVNYNAGKIVQVAFDADSGKVYWGLDNTYWDDDVSTDGNPSAGTNETTSLTTGVEYFLTLQQYSNTYVTVTNFGQDSSFAGNKTAQGNKDTNDIGDFYYAVPTGYQALCSANLPEPTISPNADTQATDHFDTFLFSGDGNNPRTLAHGLDFTPDWIWQKNRSSSWYHRLVDSSRGYAKDLFTNVSNAEEASNSGGDITAVDATNMTLQGSSHNNDINGSGENFVMWNWRANGGTTTTNDASATGVGTIDSVYQANTTAGFSIVTYTGTGSAGSIAHGLGGVPEVMFIKNRDASHSWSGTYHHKMATDPETDYLNLSGTGAVVDDSTIWNDTAPTSTVFTVGTASNTGSSDAFVAYLFRGIEGYSKFGRYTGNGSADGTYVHLGFKPALFVAKSTGTENWIVLDNKRPGYNPTGNYLYWNLSNAEGGAGGEYIDLLSNGVKLRTTGASANGSANFVYMAWAEMPFKYSLGR